MEDKKPMNKTEILLALSEATGLTKQQVGSLFDELSKLIGKNLGNDGPGTFALPGLLQIKVARKPATEEHMGTNPFTKEAMLIKAKPAKNVVKLTALKGLKGLGTVTSMELSQRIIAKVSGPAWEQLRGQFMQIGRLLLAVPPRGRGRVVHKLRQVQDR